MKGANPIKAVLCSLLIVANSYSYPQDYYFHLAPGDRVGELTGSSRKLAEIASRNRGALFDLEEFVDRLGKHPGKRVLDLGCGTGEKTASMVKDDPDILVVGIDISKDRLRSAKRKHPRSKNPNLYFFAVNAEKLPFPDNSFDLITIYYPNPISPGFTYESDYFYITFLQEAVRVARDGATILVESEDQHTQRVVSQVISRIGKCSVDPPFVRKGEYLVRKLMVTVKKDVDRLAVPVRIDPGGESLLRTSL